MLFSYNASSSFSINLSGSYNFNDNRIVFDLKNSENTSSNSPLILHVSGTDAPRVGIGFPSNEKPLQTLDIKSVKDSSQGAELLIRSSRQTVGALPGDSAGKINFTIDSGSFAKVDSSGSVAVIDAIVDTATKDGVFGALSFKVAEGASEEATEIINVSTTDTTISGSVVVLDSMTVQDTMSIQGHLTSSAISASGDIEAPNLYIGNSGDVHFISGSNPNFATIGVSTLNSKTHLLIGAGTGTNTTIFRLYDQTEAVLFENSGVSDTLVRDFRVEGKDDTHLLFTTGSPARVGIGTSTPSEKLTVEGNISSSGALTTSGVKITNLSTTTETEYIVVDSEGNLSKRSAGASGTSGTSGESGTSGSSGTSGESGTSGTSGSSGTSGTSGSSGTSGESGTSGTSGSSGTSGTSGSSGTSGESGTSGTSGSSGTSGTSGSSGTSGTSGTSGEDGANGTSGTSGESGTSGTSGASPTIANDANNRVVTAVGDGTLNGEANLTFDGSLLTINGTGSVDLLQVDDKLQGNGSGFQFFAFNEDTIKVKFANWYSSNDRQYGMGQLWYETWFAAIDNQAGRDNRRIGFYLEEPDAGSTDSGTPGQHPTNARFYVDITGSYVASGGLHVTDADFNVESNGNVEINGTLDMNNNDIDNVNNFTINNTLTATTVTGSLLRLNENGSGLRLTNVGGFEPQSGVFNIFGNNDVTFGAGGSGASERVLTLVESNRHAQFEAAVSASVFSGSFTGDGSNLTNITVAASDITGLVDISSQTNLAGGTNLTLSGDTMNLDANINITELTASKGHITTPSGEAFRIGPLYSDDDRDAFIFTPGGTTTELDITNETASFANRRGRFEFKQAENYGTATTRVSIVNGEVSASSFTGDGSNLTNITVAASDITGLVDISSQTNLAAGNGIDLTGDTISADVTSVAGQTGAVTLTADDISDTGTTNKFTTQANLTKLSNLNISGAGDFVNNEFIVAVGANAVTSSDALAVDSAGNLGIGTSTPEVRLHMVGEGSQTSQILMEQYNDNQDAPDIRTRRYRGTEAAPSDVQTGDYLFRLNVHGQDGGSSELYGSMRFDVDGTDQDALEWGLQTRDTNGTTADRITIDSSGDVTVAGELSANTINGGTF